MVDQQIRTRVWRNGVLEARDFPFEQLSDYLEQPDCLVWADLLCPDPATLSALAEELSLDGHAVEDALGRDERPKATRLGSHLFVTAYSLRDRDDARHLQLGRMSMFCTDRGFLTVRLDGGVDIDSVQQRWDDNADLLKYGSRALLHGVLDQIVDDHTDALQALDDAVEDIEDILFKDDTRSAHEVSRAIYELRGSLVQARRAVVPMRDVVTSIIRKAPENHPAELDPYYDDLSDHTLRAAEWVDSLRDMINSTFETNMQLSDNRMNQIMKKLTAWAAIIAVPTAVTGWFGQNVPYPGFSQHWGFWLSTIVIAVAAVVLYVSFRVRNWF